MTVPPVGNRHALIDSRFAFRAVVMTIAVKRTGRRGTGLTLWFGWEGFYTPTESCCAHFRDVKSLPENRPAPPHCFFDPVASGESPPAASARRPAAGMCNVCVGKANARPPASIARMIARLIRWRSSRCLAKSASFTL